MVDKDDVLIDPPASLPATIDSWLTHDEGFKPTPPSAPETDWKLNPAKQGEDYDDCPRPECGNRDVEPLYRIADKSTAFQCSCCGVAWNRETKAGHAHNEEAGLGRYSASRRTQDAAVGRTVFAPTPKYRDNYEKVFGHK